MLGAALVLLDDGRRGAVVERADRGSASEGDTAAENRRSCEQNEGPRRRTSALAARSTGACAQAPPGACGVGAVGQLEVSIHLCYTGRVVNTWLVAVKPALRVDRSHL